RSIAQACQKTPDSTDRDACRERQNQEVARCHRDAESSLDELDGDQTANETTHDRFALQEQHRTVIRRSEWREIFEGEEEVTADHATNEGRSNHNPSRPGVHDVIRAVSPPGQ